MGVRQRSDCDGDHPVELLCQNTDCEVAVFFTDETQANDCPDCAELSYQPS